MMTSLYLHLPFCRKICPYCDFCRQVYNEKTVNEYLQVLIASIPQENFNTIYLGGGTPSCLSTKQLDILLTVLKGKTTGEYTIEANVDDISEEKLVLFREYGVNRLSLGVQSFNDELLKTCGRTYDGKQTKKTLNTVAKYFDNYSIDLIYGLPNQRLDDFSADLKLAYELAIPHLSLYALTIEDNSIWGKKKIVAAEDDLMADFYLKARKELADRYEHYEISNFALPGHTVEHNKVYWHYGDYYGRGLGASSKIKDRRYTYTRVMSEYLNEQKISEDLHLSKEDQIFEYTMMNLRLAEGVDYDDFSLRYNLDFLQYYREAIKKNEQFLDINKKDLAIKKDHWFISNRILVDFLAEEIL